MQTVGAMNWHDVLERIAGGENETTEFGRFRSFSDKDWYKAACAFANTEGGLIILGVEDDGSISGVPLDAEAVHERLTNGLQNALNRPLRASLGSHASPQGMVHWVKVQRVRGAGPYTYGGRVWVRRGRSSTEPEASELQELYNTFGVFLTEERCVDDTGVHDIDVSTFRAFMARRGIMIDASDGIGIETDLVNREVLDEDGEGNLRATLFGLLCFGRDPQRLVQTQNFIIRMVAYAGTDRGADVISAAEARGRLSEQVDRSGDWFRALGRQERYVEGIRSDSLVVPEQALRECLVNAVAHRDYAITGSPVLVEVFDDRVVVSSPGALPNHKRVASVLAGGAPRSRNEAMANCLLTLGYMEQRGSGYPRIRRAMREFNDTEPDVENDTVERWVRVTLWRTPRS